MRSQCLGMCDAYSTLARFYDISIGVDYEQWVGYLLDLAFRHGHVPHRILDLGCGTGNLTIPLAQRGYELTGVDLSGAMLAVAKSKTTALGIDIPYLQGDLRSLTGLSQGFDTAISGCDVLNYLTTEDDLSRAFQTVHRHLRTGGYWFFDLNSEHKLGDVYGNQSYADLDDDFAYFWDNSYDGQRTLCTMSLTFFIRTEEGLYERKKEQHMQKLWTPETIEKLCTQHGFIFQACYDFLTLESCSDESLRWQFVLQKEKRP
ncbi:MAG: class I SAM-dependent methyltransferase [Bacillota bacterium]|jgi:SAM-dependent methyltransferase|nr:class I SAM-dependent methyltransferase [Bacillota bacterium]HHT89545.1 class I SAM-dependent methyltransferase [Bacillota bacterium]